MAGSAEHPLYVAWEHRAQVDGAGHVFPDGCTDLIVVSRCGRPDTAFMTTLDLCPRSIPLRAGDRFRGFRLRPGVQVDARSLSDGGRLVNIDSLPVHSELADVISALATVSLPIARVAKMEGVSERTLQRRFSRAALPRPEFWRLLGRVRRAAIGLKTEIHLSDLAGDLGYSDQAHMSRAFARWFGVSPSRLKRRPDLLAQIAQPGLGNWTGEQISMRYPNGSLT